MTIDTVETVKVSVEGALGILTLDRPKALNALDRPMCLAIHAALTEWAADDGVAAVLIRGSTDRAFCAGGDVRMVREDGLAWKRGDSDGALAHDFFRDEYRMNRAIKTFPKPFVALMDGVTMGGGVGLSIHGSHRIATDRTVWAMPETAIGLFPDVGTSYALPRLDGEIGTYLGLTGARIGHGDLKALGIATHIIPSQAIAGFTQDLIRSLSEAGRAADAIASAAGRHEIDGGEPGLLRHRALIDSCFAYDAVEDILSALQRDGSVFAAETLSSLGAMSPTSLKITLAELRRGRTLDFESCLRMEYRLSQSILDEHDFYEGVRAQLVDKDKQPRWRPAVLDSIEDGFIESHFRPPARGDLTFGEPPASPSHEIQD